MYPYSPGLEKRFQRMSRFDEPFSLSKKKGAQLWLPRMVCPPGPVDRRVLGESIGFANHFVPRSPEQARIVAESLALLQAGESHIVQSPTGSGKTVIGATLISAIGRKALVVVTKDDIKAQWSKALQMVLGIKPEDIGLIQGKTVSVVGKKVVIAMVHSLCKDGRYPDWVYQEFGLTVFDECHRMGADSFGKAAWLLPGKLRLGLSAQPSRKDGKDIVFRSHIGPVRVVSEAFPLIPKVMLVNGVGVPKMKVQAGRTAHVDRMLSRSAPRNRVLANFIYKCFEKGRNTVFFSSRVDHLQTIHDRLVMAGVPSKSIGFYIGGLSETEREKAKARPVVLATYQMCSEATDAPWWDTAVLGTPRSDVLQIVGRVLREYEGKCSVGQEAGGLRCPVVLDVIDSGLKLFHSYATSRQRFYQRLEAKVVRISTEELQ